MTRNDIADHSPWQFSIASMLECVTWCAIVSAFAPATGPAATSFLIAMTLALGSRQGMLAIATFAGALLAADQTAQVRAMQAMETTSAYGSVVVVLLASAVSGWYATRLAILRQRESS